MEIVILILQAIFLIITAVGMFWGKSYLAKYLEEKGKNLATKQDIEEVTHKIESVKAEIARGQAIQTKKYELKYQACLDALAIMDPHLSHMDWKSPEGRELEVTKQFTTAEQARACHSRLILSCEDTQLLEKFAEILFGPSTHHQQGKPLTDLLNEFRNLIRKELGFGTELQLDRQRAWVVFLGKISAEAAPIPDPSRM